MMIDNEVRKLLDNTYEKTKKLLVEKKADVEKLAHALLEKEVLFQSDVEMLIGKRPFEEKKVLTADEVKEEPALGESAVAAAPKTEDDKAEGQAGNLGWAPSV